MKPSSTPSRVARLGVATLALGLVLSACGEEESDPTSATPAPSATPSESPTDEPTETPDPSDETTTVPVYFVGDAAQGPRLFREFQEVTGDPLTEAALLLDAGTTLDPDYRTNWPGGAITSAEQADGEITVLLDADAFTTRPDGMRPRDARLAVQQMVHTLQGVAQEQSPVRFVREDGPQTLFDLDISDPFERADWLDVMSMMNVTTPAQGATVTGDTLEAEGLGSSFEATVLWEIRQGDKVVLDGFTTGEGWMDKLHPWSASIDISSLEPGDYTFAALTDDPSGGEEGFGPTEDTKDFTRE